MPFYNISRVVRTVSPILSTDRYLAEARTRLQIIFNTKNEIAKNLGILLAWVALSIITISIATWATRRKSVNAHRQAMGKRGLNEKPV